MDEFNKLTSADYKYIESIVGSSDVSVSEEELITHSRDASIIEWHKPDIVVWPESKVEVAEILKYASRRRIPVTPWGAGSSLSGNPVPIYGGIVLDMKKMDKIVEVREKDFQVVVQPGVNYDRLNKFLSKFRLFFPPDPGSSSICTIGGMVANNSSGMRAVHYGVTRDFVLKLEVVLPSGEVINVGSNAIKSASGYDLVGLFVGSEGTLGVFTEITLKLRPLPQNTATFVAYFKSTKGAAEAVSEIMTSDLRPAALEFLDKQTIVAINRFKKLNLIECEAMLLVEFHGDGSASNMRRAIDICKKHDFLTAWPAEDEKTKERLWEGRKGAYSALVQSNTLPLVGDVAVPISRFADLVEAIYTLSKQYSLPIACAGHAGDGNLHTMIFGDRNNPEAWAKALRLNEEIVLLALSMGGVSSAEHGVGSEKKKFMAKEHGKALLLMRGIKRLIDPYNIMNPGKMFD
jgi:glycolate oxidase subunit GlcD